MKDNGIRVEYEDSDYGNGKGFDFGALAERNRQRVEEVRKTSLPASDNRKVQALHEMPISNGEIVQEMAGRTTCDSHSPETGKRCGQPSGHKVRHSNGLETWD